MPTCPNGHQSGSDDWCEVCGHRMAGAGAPAGAVPPPPPPPPPPPAYGYPGPGGPPPRPGGFPGGDPNATAQAELCPQCRTPREAMAPFCEECRWNFLTNTATSYTPLAPPQGGPGGPPPGLNLPPGFQSQPPSQPQAPRPPDPYEYQSSRPSQMNRPAEPLPPEPSTPRRPPQGPPPVPQAFQQPPGPPRPPQAFQQPGPPPPPQPRPTDGGGDDWMLPPPSQPQAQPPARPEQPERPREPGPQGHQQPQGHQGPHGPQGPNSPQGTHSPQGSQGPHGPQPPHAPQPPHSPQPPQYQAAPAGWTAVVAPDREYFMAMMQRSGPEAAGLNLPAYSPEQRLSLSGNQISIGRRRHSTGESPDIDLSVPPEDPGVSHHHAVLVQQPDGSWAVVDQNSTNGTTLNGAEDPIQPYVPVPLKDGDRVHVGAWTTITIRRG
ncbi:FHA domain-containing protein [Streptomyces sp. CB03238]|uniref:FHA domain-containing protein n=1 Tax=Streptomyces sp. CB03238 TaxID=1907777 RepID=UPI000A0FB076|nr:FHA domain-containing protein [Streptomyces sp. CB03238]ORT61714.1 forkhead-associated protein [Streptomyces sp. CB03238]